MARRHRKLQRAVDAWVDGELGPVAAAAGRTHLDDCWDCSSAAETLRLLTRSLASLRRSAPPGIAAARLRPYADRLVRT